MEAVTITQISPPELGILIENSIRRVLSGKTLLQHSDSYITRQEAAEILNITLPTLQSWTLGGKIQGYRKGRRVLYKKDEIEQAKNTISTQPQNY